MRGERKAEIEEVNREAQRAQMKTEERGEKYFCGMENAKAAEAKAQR